MSNLSNDESTFRFQEFDLNENNEASESSEDSNNEVNNTFKFNNDILNNLLANIKDNDDNNIESYLKEYNSKIDVEIEDERDNIGDDKRNTNNKCDEELDELISDDEFNEFIQESSALTPCLGVCDLHFLYDQNQIYNSKDKLKKFNEAIIQYRRCLSCKKDITFFSREKRCNNYSWLINGRNIQIPCNGLVRCNALKEFSTTSVTLCKCAFNEIEQSRCICCICYERLSEHIHVRTGRGHQSNCIHDGLHKQDITEGIKCIANWLIGISNTNDKLKKKEILNSITEALIPFIPASIIKTTLSNYASFQSSNNFKKNYDETPSLFII
ncbi:hypothetical protein Glove_4g19 [Diversispora epigaea]|uniref:Uncharacterized protein n=1 Tax=Diversispora epigaea TaxID=1348612 RepID=A0A397JY49_9GLOM|nr:hypothetical protein Glove_4g19 [Diversispora epigaea]